MNSESVASQIDAAQIELLFNKPLPKLGKNERQEKYRSKGKDK